MRYPVSLKKKAQKIINSTLIHSSDQLIHFYPPFPGIIHTFGAERAIEVSQQYHTQLANKNYEDCFALLAAEVGATRLANQPTFVAKPTGEPSQLCRLNVRRAKRVNPASPGQGDTPLAQHNRKYIPHSAILPTRMETQRVGYIVGTFRKRLTLSPTNTYHGGP